MLERLKGYAWLLFLAGGLFAIPFFDRNDFFTISVAYLIAFLGYIYVVFLSKKDFTTKEIILIAIALRLLFLFSIPNLSNDFYRFIWDGHVILNGINPYLYTPQELQNTLMQQSLGAEFLFNQMNSAGYISVYPPFAQLLYSLSALVGGGSTMLNVLTLRSILIGFEIALILLMIKTCELFKISSKNVILYAFNPLIILEISGNLHGEGVMLFFLFAALYYLKKSENTVHLILSAACMACGIMTKLIPVIFIPFILFSLGWKKSLVWIFWIGIISFLLFIPFYTPELLNKYGESLDLFFRKFEFNASIYYLINKVATSSKGYNTIALIGPLLSLLAFFLIVFAAFKSRFSKNNLFDFMMIGFTIHLFLSTTVHPWYLATLIAFTVFSGFRFSILWSLTVILSYHMYGNNTIEKPLMLIAAYLPVYIFFLLELRGMGKFRIKLFAPSDENQ